jgi:hypothetical protein
MRRRSLVSMAVITLLAAACTGQEAVLVGDSINAASGVLDPPVMRGLDGIDGWARSGPPERYNKEGLYGYIDGGAEIVLQYGFRELSVSRYGPTGGASAGKEIVLEIYRMDSGTSAFGLYSTKLEGGEKAWPRIKPDHWIGPGQAGLVNGDYFVSILAPDCAAEEIGPFLKAVAGRIPGYGTSRPKGLGWLPAEGMVPGSRRYIRGPLAAQNESPFLDGDFWGFTAAAAGKDATEAYSAKYGVAPAVSKLAVVRLEKAAAGPAVDDGVFGLFTGYLQGVKRDGAIIEGRNEAGRWFLFERKGGVAVLVLADPDRAAGVVRLGAALALAVPHASFRP